MPEWTQFWHEMVKIVSDTAGGAYDTPPDPLVVRGFLPSAFEKGYVTDICNMTIYVI